jgi:hypothetical protein
MTTEVTASVAEGRPAEVKRRTLGHVTPLANRAEVFILKLACRLRQSAAADVQWADRVALSAHSRFCRTNRSHHDAMVFVNYRLEKL